MDAQFSSDFLKFLSSKRALYIGYPHIYVDRDNKVHYPCTIQIMPFKEDTGKLFWFYGQIYPKSVYDWYGPQLPFSTGE